MRKPIVNSDRFQIRRLLGKGGMGEVYEAYDRERGMDVAVKTLRRLDAASIYRFKREFRALADVSHPNLIALHELLSTDRQWLFTMELVDGVDFLSHVAPTVRWSDGATSARHVGAAGSDGEADAPADDGRDRGAGPGDAGAAPGDPDGPGACVGGKVEPGRGDAGAAPGDPDAPGPCAGSRDASAPTSTLPTGVMAPVAPPPRVGKFDERRLRAALVQLAEGVLALHESGRLHHDIKPSNVLVTRRGRVVLLDFGVITGMSARAWQDLCGDRGGTPAYMAPERFEPGTTPTAASDWYSVGVMLHIALTGQRPAPASPDSPGAAPPQPARPRQLCPDVPPDLDALCVDLMRPDPADRPSGHDVVARLRAAALRTEAARRAADRPPSDTSPPRAELAPVFLGREAPLAALRQALADTRRGVGATVYVHGSSGMGKTELVARFLDEVARDGEAVVLAGRCYQRESVPYKAVDSLIDALARHLVALSPDASPGDGPEAEPEAEPEAGPDASPEDGSEPRGGDGGDDNDEVSALVPDDVALLARLFPVLRQVPAIARAQEPDWTALDPHHIRDRAFVALRTLLERLAARRPLVLYIDDLQWGDIDSAPLLGGLMHPPRRPPLLFIASYRSEDAARSPLLLALGRTADRWGGDRDTRVITVGPLSRDDGRALACALLADAADAAAADTIAREAAKHPYFIHELARFAHAQTTGGARAPLTLDRVLSARVAELPADARRVLELVAVAGVPTHQHVLRRAAGLDPGTWEVQVSRLHTANLVRHAGARRGRLVEAFHDRIRETIVDMLPPDRRADHHRRLADSVREAYAGDAAADGRGAGGLDGSIDETLVRHYRGAGEHALAALHAERAATAADSALAFDRAAALYRVALYLGDHEPDRAQALRVRLAESLRHAGHGAEAGEAFLAAAEHADPASRREQRTRAAEQLMISGHIEQGLAAIDVLLAETGLRYPRSQRAAVAALLWHRLWLRLRGLGWRERAAPPDDAALARLDVCQAVRDGLAMVDNIRGAYFQARALRMSLDAGDPLRVGHALGREAIFLASYGRDARAQRLIARVRSIARARDDRDLAGWADAMEAMSHYLAGRFRDAATTLSAAEAKLRDQPRADAMVVNNVRLFRLFAARRLGTYRDQEQLYDAYLADAVRRGDLYAETSMRCAANVLWLVRDRPDEARRDLDQATWAPVEGGFHLQHWYGFEARAEIALYAGSVAAERDPLDDGFRALERSELLRVTLIRITVRWLRGRLALALAGDPAAAAPDRARARRVAARCCRQLARERPRYGALYAAMLRAGLEAVRAGGEDATVRRRAAGAAGRAIDTLARVADAGDDVLPGMAAAAAYRRGQLIGGDEGAGLIEQARRRFAGQGVRDVERLLGMLAPGFPRPRAG